MSKLYEDLAPVYEAMYQTFIDYREEFDFYSNILKQFKKENLLEIGSGTGNLAKYFHENGFEYIGLDFSKAMIALAKKRIHDGEFIYGDMRNFKLEQPVESIISTGRTISHLIQNKDVNAAFVSFYDNLSNGGIVCFDFIDANIFIPAIAKGKEITHQAVYNNTTYIRKSTWNLNLQYGMDFEWDSIFYKEEGKKLINIGEDKTIARTFTVNEIEIFLSINGFKVLERIERASYAFPTYVIVAKKIN
ncbi:MAG: SAM-dependent methyltransferase [Saprospiraceae bacterium]|jgi:SAM-dependent methyltransferase